MFSNRYQRRVLFFVIFALPVLFGSFVGLAENASAASYRKSSSAPSYSKVDQYVGLGEVTNWAVGASSSGQGQRIYISYKYYNDSFDLVEADPFSGNFQVHASPIAGEWGANAEVTGSDGNIYLGTTPHAHWVRYAPSTGTMTDLGSASATEQYIWGLSTAGVYKIDISTNNVTVFPAPVAITGGFVFVPDKVNGDSIYFASHSYVYKFRAM